MALSPVSGYDNFYRSLTGSWGTASSGQTWTNGNSNYSVSGGMGTIFVPANQANRNIRLSATGTDRTKGEVLCKVYWNGTDPLTSHGPSLNVSAGGTSCYYLSIEDYYGEVALRLVDGSGVMYEQNRVSFVTHDHTWYWVRFRVDTQLQAKIWAEGTVEPGSWTITSALYSGGGGPGAGQPGYFVRGMSASGGSSYTVSVDTYYYYTTTDDTYTSWPITDTFVKGGADDGFAWASTGHLWEGNFADDPNYYSKHGIGSVDSSTNNAIVTQSASGDSYGFIGPSVSGDSQVLMKFKFDSTTVSYIQAGLRGSFSASGGNISVPNAYYARVDAGGTQFTFFKFVSSVGTTLTLTTNTPFTALLANTFYWIRFQIVGTTLQARLWLDGNTEPGTWNAAKVDTSLTSGKAFLTVSQTSSATRTTTINQVGWSYVTTSNSTTPGALTSTAATDTTITCQQAFTGDANASNALTVNYRPTGTDTFMGASTSALPARSSTFYTFTVINLAHGTSYDIQTQFIDVDGVSGNDTTTNTFSTTNLGTDLTASAFALTNLTSTTLTLNYTYANDTNSNNSALLEKSVSGSGIWTTVTAAMTKTTIGGIKQFTTNVTSLTADTNYIFRVTVTDTDGISGTNPQTTTTTTLGKSISPTTIGASVTDTSATVSAFYIYDTNNDSSASFQYRAVTDLLYTTVPTTSVSVDRTNKLFFVTLFPLLPAMTYEVVATFSDPDGIASGSPTTQTLLLTTTGSSLILDKRTKHYQWKIYDTSVPPVYLGTWPDAPEPNFKYELNGGATDITTHLPRPISIINQTVTTIDYDNRVDIWAIDPSSDGMGPNLVVDSDMDLGSWVLGTNWSIDPTGGPDGSNALKFSSVSSTVYTTRSEPIYPFGSVELVFKLIVKTLGSKVQIFVESYDAGNVLLEQSAAFTESVGGSWQVLRLDYIPPVNVSYVKLCIQNEGAGTAWADKCTVLPKEYLAYRGKIETFTPKIDATAESVDVNILGLVSLLSNDYVDFLQFVTVQPSKDVRAARPNQGAMDPADMFRKLIDYCRALNPKFSIYYTSTSIQNVGTVSEYTFRHHQIRQAFDRILKFAPPDWSYYIEPDGKFVFRGPDLGKTHTLRIGVELSSFEVAKSIANLKNYIYILGRVDDTNTQPDGYGTIEYTAFDQNSINKYGRRYIVIRDTNITHPDTARDVGDGRLFEYNRVELKGKGIVPDEKTLLYTGGSLRGYNVESFRPGDKLFVLDPRSGTGNDYWDQMIWDTDTWDTRLYNPLPQSVPIVAILYQGAVVEIQTSERQPSMTGSFAKLYRFLQNSESDKESQL